MDTTLQLGFSMQNNPGVYAVLLGSGISRAAGIPTGWEIAQDLIKQIKNAGGEELSDDTGYDEILKTLAKTKAERSAMLRGYFEPSEEEREQGVKLPTAAHKALAQLVKDGYIRVVLTTNFDRLTEIALEEIGIIPNVIRSDDMIEGAPPIRHSQIVIIQLHGDYRDIRSLNTAEELENYSEPKNRLLETVFDEYGLIVCGWSATWDTALRNSLLRAKSRRYSIFWVDPNDLSDFAEDVINHRGAEVIRETADSFFVNLQGQVEALAKLRREHPQSIAVAVERVKRLIPHSHTQIELEDLIRDEADSAYERFTALESGNVVHSATKDIDELYKERFATAFTVTETVLNMMATLCWHGNGVQSDLISELLRKWATPRDIQEEASTWRRMPALALMYVCGLASVRRDKWDYLQAIVVEPKIISPHSQQTTPLFEFVKKRTVFHRVGSRGDFEYDPLAIVIGRQLRPVFKRYISSDTEFDLWFDLYEHILAVTALKCSDKSWILHNAAFGDYAAPKLWDFIKEFYRKGGRLGKNWGFLKTIFGGDDKILEATLQQYREFANKSSAWAQVTPDYFAEYRGRGSGAK